MVVWRCLGLSYLTMCLNFLFKRFYLGLSFQKMKESEIALLSYFGLKPQDYTLEDVKIELDVKQDLVCTDNIAELYIHTLKIPQMSKEEYNKLGLKQPYKRRRMLFLPGWAAGSSLYCPIFKEMSRHFEITCIDILGMGASGRPGYNAYTPQRAIDFFMLQMEAWMKATKYAEQGPFHFLGHSMGCYFASHYKVKYPDQIQ